MCLLQEVASNKEENKEKECFSQKTFLCLVMKDCGKYVQIMLCITVLKHVKLKCLCKKSLKQHVR